MVQGFPSLISEFLNCKIQELVCEFSSANSQNRIFFQDLEKENRNFYVKTYHFE
jgi:hypothetical protein